ncbi:hypothetical protein [Bradyrhizobium cenepequi]
MTEEITDEACIAIAMLHGCELNGDPPESGAYLAPGERRWCIGSEDSPMHPIEKAQHEATGSPWFPTAEELARKYCEYYNLLR